MRLIIVVGALVAPLFFGPLAHADTTTAVPIGDPYTDTLQLWSEIAASIQYVGHQLAIALEPNHRTAVAPPKLAAAAVSAQNHAVEAGAAEQTLQPLITYSVQAGDTLSSIAQMFTVPLSNILAANDLSQGAILRPGENLIIPDPQTAPGIASEPASDATPNQSTNSQNASSAESSITASRNATVSILPASTPIFDSSNFVTQAQFNNAFSQLGQAVRQLIAATDTAPVPEYVAGDGNPEVPYAAENAIDNLSNVTITNASLAASEIPDLSGTYLSLSGGSLIGALTSLPG